VFVGRIRFEHCFLIVGAEILPVLVFTLIVRMGPLLWQLVVLVLVFFFVFHFVQDMSFKKAQKRFQKTNRERSQPAHRQKLGLLEKHADYVKRARDYNAKKEELRQLQEKASLKNPDEFFFGMEKVVMSDGKLVEKVKPEDATMSADALKALKTHDHAYLVVESQKERKKIEKMKAELQFVGVVRPSNHTVFVDDEEEALNFDAAKYFDTEPELVNRFHNRLRKHQLEEDVFEEGEDVQQHKKRKYKELESRVKRK
jgi:U3 small nucleolar RNA-associated protein 11